jgi:hypothetical protein
LTKQLTLLSIIFSLTACAGITKPDTDVCIVNAPNKNRKCYNMATDYDDNGQRLATAKPVYRPNAQISDLNKFLCIDSPTGTVDGQAALSAWIQKIRQHFKDCQNPSSAQQAQ